MDDTIRNRWYMSFGGSFNVLIGLGIAIASEKLVLVAAPFIIGGCVMKFVAFLDAVNQGIRRGE